VDVSSDEDDGLKPDALADKKKASASDDTEDGGVSSAEPIAPNLINSDVLEQSDPFVVDQVATTVLPTGERGRKCPPPATRRNKPLQQVDKVMTQIELPPYHDPRSPLDLVAIEIGFRRIFEVF
jgi:hypothetical protein